MSRGKHTEAQMIAAVKQMEAGRKAEDAAREVGVSTHTIYAWKSKSGGMDGSEAQEARRLRDENARLRKLVADLSVDKDALQYVIEKNGWSSYPTNEDLSAGTPNHSDEGICRAYPGEVCLHRTPGLQAADGSGFELSLQAKPERRSSARPADRSGAREAALRLSSPACAAGSRRGSCEPQAGSSDLPRSRPGAAQENPRQLTHRLQPQEATQQPELYDTIGVRRKSKPRKRRGLRPLGKRYNRLPLYLRCCYWLTYLRNVRKMGQVKILH